MHVYAHLGEFKDYVRDAGSTALGVTNDDRMLGILASVSRRIDKYCNRSRFGSGFGPRVGTNRYDSHGGSRLHLRDDLLALTAVTLRASTGSADTESPVAETDYYLEPYDQAPYRELVLHGEGTVVSLGSGRRSNELAGRWGYQDVTEPLSATTAEALDASETDVDVSAITELWPGMTLLLGSEQAYVRTRTDATPDRIAVVRGANGTTAATHDTGLAIARYVYPAEVTDVTLRLALRRWKARDAGADGSDGGGQVSMITPTEGEDTILRRGVGHLRFFGIG